MKYFSFSLLTLFGMSQTLSQIVLNEILYDPDGTDTGGEMIEIRNAGTTSADLTGFDLYPDGIGYFTFPSVLLEPGAIAVVHLRQTGIDTESDFYHFAPTSNLGNSSGSAALFNGSTHSSSTIVGFVQWGAGSKPWASAAVTAGVWNDVSEFVPVVSEGHSVEYDGMGVSAADWFDQASPTFGAANALPVQLLTFSGRRSKEGVVLRWETASETDNFGFEIERRVMDASKSADTPWTRIGFVPGAGTSSARKEYSFVDPQAGDRGFEYRLLQLDRNGASRLSGIVVVRPAKQPESLLFECFPNPFNPSTTIRFSVPNEGDVRVRLFDSAGQNVTTLFSGGARPGTMYSILLEGRALSSGFYVALCEFGGKTVSKKILLVR